MEANTPCMFFYEKNNQGKQDIFTAIALFQNMVAEVGEVATVVNISFEESGSKIMFLICIIY